MVLIKNKRGIFFTSLVIIILSLFIITFTFFSNVEKRESIQNRITTMNSFVFSVEEDIPRKLGISTFRILFLLEKDIIETNSYISDLNESFEEAFYNGTINGKTSSEIESLMEGVTFSGIETELKQKAQKINADVSLLNPKIRISQDDPWEVKLTLEINLIIKDLSDLAIWNKTTNITGSTKITNLEDPLYLVSTDGLVTNIITKTPYQDFVQGSDVSNLSDHATNSYYISSTDAPSFIDRIQGININSTNGIESIVDLADLSSQGISTKSKSVVDYIYFSSSDPGSCKVQPTGMPSWFRLDSDHLSTYEVTCL